MTTTVAACLFTEASDVALDAHTTEGPPDGVGDTWTKHPATDGGATMKIVSATGRAKAEAGLDSIYLASGVPAHADQDVTATVVQVAESGGLGVVARCDPTALTCYLTYYEPGSDTHNLAKFVAGTFTALGTPWGEALSAEDAREHRLECRGTAIKLYVAGVERISVTDGDVTAAGRVGLYGYGSNDNAFDPQAADFLATDERMAGGLAPGVVAAHYARRRAT